MEVVRTEFGYEISAKNKKTLLIYLKCAKANLPEAPSK